MPNTPRERLERLQDREGRVIAGLRELRKRPEADHWLSDAVMTLVETQAETTRELCSALLDAGLLDQAGHEGGGEEAVNVQASGETATAAISHAGSVSVSEQSRSPVELPSPTVPQPPASAPASVEGVVVNHHDLMPNWYVSIVVLPDDWKPGTRVRITPLDPEAT